MVARHRMVMCQGKHHGWRRDGAAISLRYHRNAHHMRTLMPWSLARSTWCRQTVPQRASRVAHSSDTARSYWRRQQISLQTQLCCNMARRAPEFVNAQQWFSRLCHLLYSPAPQLAPIFLGGPLGWLGLTMTRFRTLGSAQGKHQRGQTGGCRQIRCS